MEFARRDFVKGAALGAATLSVGGIALAEETAGNGTFADTVKWDAEYDVVVLGMGFAGMITAFTAADDGASVLICEKLDEGEAGGNSRVCGQGFAYAHDDAEGAYKYYTSLAGGRDVPDDMIRTLADGVAKTADYLESLGFDRSQFYDLPAGTSVCPEYPEFEGGENITQSYVHEGSSDAYIYQTLKERMATQYTGKIDVWYETPGISLVQDPVSKAIIGVTVDRKGTSRNVRALNGVVVCTGGFENDPEMVQHYLGVINYTPMGTLHNTGDGIKMCQAVGARLWHMTSYEGAFSMCGCSYDFPEDFIAALPFNPGQGVMDQGATVMVGTWGKRFCNESYTPRHGHMPDGNGLWENVKYPEKIWVIWDKTQMDAIDEAGALNEDFRDSIIACPTIADIVSATGMHEEVISKTIEDFNSYAESGNDAEFGRLPETMRAFDDADGYYVMPMKSLILNTQGGPERNVNTEVIGLDGNPIPHLYAAGEMGGLTACMYQSGTNTAECYTFGQIAGHNAATAKDPLPAYEAPSFVESTPAHVGEESDLLPSE